MELTPFDRKKHTPIKNNDGSETTERTVTVPSPDGSWWNVPSVWWSDIGKPLTLTEDEAATVAAEFEQRSGKSFPRFGTVEEAVKAAQGRSKRGGGKQGVIAK